MKTSLGIFLLLKNRSLVVTVVTYPSAAPRCATRGGRCKGRERPSGRCLFPRSSPVKVHGRAPRRRIAKTGERHKAWILRVPG